MSILKFFSLQKPSTNLSGVHSEVDFTADVQDFQSQLEPHEKNAVKNALLAIAQIEVSVKTFWGNLYSHMPKPELNGLGATFAECEFRHSEAYSRLLEVLGYNEEFTHVVEVPALKKRIDFLSNVLKHANSSTPKEYVSSLLLFSILIEMFRFSHNLRSFFLSQDSKDT